MTSAWLHQLGALLKQAEKRLGEIDNEHARLDDERSQILAAFPQLKKARAYKSKGHAVLFDAAKAEQSAPTKRVKRKWTPEQKAEIVERIRKGESVTTVARDTTAHVSQVREWSAAAGVTPVSAKMDAVTPTLEWARKIGRAVTIKECAEHFQIPRKGTAEMRLRTLERHKLARRIAPGTFELTAKGKAGTNGHTRATRTRSEAGLVATAGKGIAPDVVAKALDLIGNGQGNARIAKQLGIGKPTVRRLREQRKREAQS